MTLHPAVGAATVRERGATPRSLTVAARTRTPRACFPATDRAMRKIVSTSLWLFCPAGLAVALALGSTGGPLPPAAALKHFKVAPELEWDQVLAEPVVRQPVSVSFDERGRLWVVQYLQYPHPAGLKMLSRDKYWR